MRKVSKLQAFVAIGAALSVVLAAFVMPATAKKGHGKGKKATIVSWDEATRALVLTNKKAVEQTFTLAVDAKLTKVVPCEDGVDPEETEDGTKTCGSMDATTADLQPGYRALNWKADDGVISRLKVKVPHESPEETEQENCDDAATTDVVEECPQETPLPSETPTSDQVTPAP